MDGMEIALASGILKLVGNKLAPLLIKEYNSIVGVEKDLKELHDLVEEINSWLERAGYIASGNDSSFNWLKKLKDVAYDVDDVVDEFQQKVEKYEAHGDGSGVSKYMHKKGKSFIFQSNAASKVKAIKKRFSAIVRQRTEFSAIANNFPGGHLVHHMKQTTVVMPTLPIVDVSSVIGRDQDKSKIISKLKEVKDQQEIEIVSVIGLGGSGKTTLAKLVFNDDNTIKKIFEVRLWVHVSQESSVTGLIKKLFEGISEERSKHHNLNRMSERISNELTGKRFLLVLDDVWIEDRVQWQQFREQFMVHLKSGTPTSKILLTTRSQRVAEVVESTYLFHLPLLSPDDSWQLFARRFSATIPSEFEEVGKEIVKKCGGVPLAVIALACVLRDKERIEQWQAIRNNSLLDVGDAQDGIFARLRLSYFYLPSHLKPCFTICSIFPKGYRINKGQLIDRWISHDMIVVEDGVDNLEYTADMYFNSLVQMSFLQDVEETYSGRVECRMHDVVHDLARSILNNDEILLDGVNEGTNFEKTYRYFSLNEEPRSIIHKNIFKKARAIVAYELNNSIFGKAWKNAKHLRSVTVLKYGCTESTLTSILQIKTLRYLEVQGLKCERLPESISNIWSLQSLHLTSSDLVELPKTIGKLLKLRTLNLSYCSKLKCLPDSIGDCQLISSIDLRSCITLAALPNSIGRNKNLRVLRLYSTKIVRLPSSITTLRNLECLDLQHCIWLVELPEDIGNMEKLQVLNLKGCGNLGGMPVGIGQLSRLQKLGLFVVGQGKKFADISKLANLPRIGEELSIKVISHEMNPYDAYMSRLKEKTNLQRLDINWMAHDTSEVDTEVEQAVLDCLEPPPGIEELEIVGYSGKQHTRWMQNQVGGRSQGLPYFLFLRVMELSDFPNLKHLHGLVELPSLEELKLKNMPSLESTSGGPFPSLVKLCMHELPSLGEMWMVAERTMPDGEEGCGCSNCTHNFGYVEVGSCLSYMEISDCPELKVKPYLPLSLQELSLSKTNKQLLQLPSECKKGSPSFSIFSHLKKLVLKGMAGSGSGWEAMQLATTLQSSDITDLDVRNLPECLRSLTSFQSLQELTIDGCFRLSTFPQSIGHLTSLQVLWIGWCRGLHQLPEYLAELCSLRKLHIEYLPELTCLPMSMCGLTSLEELYIEYCSVIKSLPEGMRGLTSLKQLKINFCESLSSIPQSMGHVTSLQELTIASCESLISLPESLGELRSLCTLEINRLNGLTCLPQSICSLTSLEKLTITSCSGLSSLPEGIKGLASLKELEIHNCRGIKSLPQGIIDLTALKRLHISNCPNLMERCERGKGKDWDLISRIPDINMWCW